MRRLLNEHYPCLIEGKFVFPPAGSDSLMPFMARFAAECSSCVVYAIPFRNIVNVLGNVSHLVLLRRIVRDKSTTDSHLLLDMRNILTSSDRTKNYQRYLYSHLAENLDTVCS